MRSIYLGKGNTLTNEKACPNCGGPKVIKPVGWTVGGEAVYGCRDGWHVKEGS